MTGTRQLTPHHAVATVIAGLAALDTSDAAGAGEFRPTVLMVPGYTGSKEDFSPILDPLADNGFRAIAVDLPGQYQSPGSDDEADYLPPALGEHVAALVNSFAGPTVLIGHSYGGLVTRAATLAGARLAGLILLCSGPAALPSGPRMDALVAGEPVMRSQGPEAAFELKQQLVAALQQPPPPPELADFLRTRFLASTTAGLLGMGTGLKDETDQVAELATEVQRTQTPVAVISGEADDAWGLDRQADMARRLGTPLTVIPGAGHSPAIEQPERLMRILLGLLRTWTPHTTPSGEDHLRSR